MIIAPDSNLTYTFASNINLRGVVFEDVKHVQNNGTFTLQGVQTFLTHVEPISAGEEDRYSATVSGGSVQSRAGGSIQFRNVIYSGTGRFILPVEQNTLSTIFFSDGELNSPIKLEVKGIGKNYSFPPQQIIYMTNTKFAKWLNMDNAVVLLSNETEGLKLKLTHREELSAYEGKKWVSMYWYIEGVQDK